MENHPIKTRKYYAVDIILASPLCVSSGQNEETDADVMVNGHGEVFIAGTTLAGAMRSYLELKKEEPGIMGYSKINRGGKKEDEASLGRMSSVFISDLYFQRDGKKPVVSVRDGVMLSEEKTVENKFDMEIIETGARGTIYLNYLVREGERQDRFEERIQDIFQGIQNGSIRIGANKNRGFGRLQIEIIYQKEFCCEESGFDVTKWREFKKNAREVEGYSRKETFAEWNARQEREERKKFVKITVPLKLNGGISIRKYSARPEMADYEHITCAGQPVIPGSSWNGAIRADVKNILRSMGLSDERVNERMELWFGMVSPKDKTAWQSRIVVGESRITGAARLAMTRNKINRFDASTIDTALYSEISYFGGKTELEIMVRKDSETDDRDYNYRALLAVLEIVIQDIEDGYVPVGGLVAVGRGIFMKDEDREITCSEEIATEENHEALYALQ